MRRTSMAVPALAAALVLAGCDFKGDNIPLEVAKYQPPKPLVEQTVRLVPEPEIAERPVVVAERRWLPTATEYELPDRMVRPVGSAAGATFYAFAWDDEPYDRLLLPRRPGLWREYLEVY